MQPRLTTWQIAGRPKPPPQREQKWRAAWAVGLTWTNSFRKRTSAPALTTPARRSRSFSAEGRRCSRAEGGEGTMSGAERLDAVDRGSRIDLDGENDGGAATDD